MKHRENGRRTGKSVVMQIGEWPILIGNNGLYSLVPKTFAMLLFSYMLDPIIF